MKFVANIVKLLLFICLIGSANLYSQVKIGNNPKVMLPGALLELEHESKALVITRVTTAQMNAIQANEGMLVYNTTDSCIYQRTSTTWKSLCSSNVSPQNLTNGRGIIVMDGTGAVLKATSLRIDSSEIAKMLGEKPMIDSLAKIIGRAPIKDSIVKLIKDSISSIISNGNISGKNVTQGSLITVTGGTGAVLKDMKIEADTVAMNTFIANNLKSSPIKDSLSSSITNIINNGSVSGKNMTSGNLVTLSGTPTGSLLKDVNIDINTTKLKDSMAAWINDKPISDSITKYVSNDATIIKTMKDSVIKEINNGGVTGKSMTSGSLVNLTGTPTGSLLKDVNIDINTTKLKDSMASWINDKPISDSISKFVSTDSVIVKNLKDSVIKEITIGSVTGKNATQGELIKVTDGTGAVLKDMKIEADTAAMKTFIANNLNSSPIKDSLSSSITNIINNGSVSGKNMTSGNLVTLTGTPTGSLLKDVNIDINTTKLKDSMASWINDKPISDSISKFVSTDSVIVKNLKDSVIKEIQSGGVVVKDMTNGDLIKLSGKPIGALFNDVKIDVNTTKLKDSIASWVNSKPISDSITRLMKDSISSIISNGAVSGKALTGVGIKVSANGATSILKDVTITWDSTAIYSRLASDSTKYSKYKNMATNGTSVSNDSIVLGGTLDRATTITISATNTLSIKGLQAGNAKTDSILSDSAGVVKHVSIKDVLSSGPNWVEITSSYTAKTTDQIILFRGTSNATLTLPSASAVAGKIIEIMNYAPNNNEVILTISPSIVTMGASTDLVDTELSNILKYYGNSAGATGGNSIRVFSNGTSWFKLSN